MMRHRYSFKPIVFKAEVSGLRVATNANGALIDNAGAVVPTFADGNHSIEIYCPTGCLLKGVLSAAGSGETDTELVTDLSFTDATKWTAAEGWTVNNAGDGNAVGSAGVASTLTILPAPSAASGALFLFSATVQAQNAGVTSAIGANTGVTLSTGAYAAYLTNVSEGTAYGLRKSAGGACIINAMSIKKILTPSTSGALIVDAKGSVTRNWTVNQWVAGSYNATSNLVVVRKL